MSQCPMSHVAKVAKLVVAIHPDPALPNIPITRLCVSNTMREQHDALCYPHPQPTMNGADAGPLASSRAVR